MPEPPPPVPPHEDAIPATHLTTPGLPRSHAITYAKEQLVADNGLQRGPSHAPLTTSLRRRARILGYLKRQRVITVDADADVLCVSD
jgi:hypothetical protein